MTNSVKGRSVIVTGADTAVREGFDALLDPGGKSLKILIDITR